MALYFVAFEYLHATGYCHRDGRYLTDEELISLAADAAVTTNRAYAAIEQRLEYASAEDLIARNPACCAVIKNQNDDPFLRDVRPDMVFGPYVFVVELIYRARQNDPNPFDDDTYYFGACGERLDHSGPVKVYGRQTTKP